MPAGPTQGMAGLSVCFCGHDRANHTPTNGQPTTCSICTDAHTFSPDPPFYPQNAPLESEI